VTTLITAAKETIAELAIIKLVIRLRVVRFGL